MGWLWLATELLLLRNKSRVSLYISFCKYCPLRWAAQNIYSLVLKHGIRNRIVINYFGDYGQTLCILIQFFFQGTRNICIAVWLVNYIMSTVTLLNVNQSHRWLKRGTCILYFDTAFLGSFRIKRSQTWWKCFIIRAIYRLQTITIILL